MVTFFFAADEEWLDELETMLSPKRRLRRSRGSRDKARMRQPQSKPKRYFKEMARALRIQKRREKSRALITGEQSQSSGQGLKETPPIENPGELDAKLGKLKARIADIKNRLEMLRIKRKKLMQIKLSKAVFEEVPCPCTTTPSPNSPINPQRVTEKGESEDAISGLNKSLSKKKTRTVKEGFRSRLSPRKNKKQKAKPRREKCAAAGLNCFYQTNYHWKLPPLWTGRELSYSCSLLLLSLSLSLSSS